jgi:hypothetical protein
LIVVSVFNFIMSKEFSSHDINKFKLPCGVVDFGNEPIITPETITSETVFISFCLSSSESIFLVAPLILFFFRGP